MVFEAFVYQLHDRGVVAVNKTKPVPVRHTQVTFTARLSEDLHLLLRKTQKERTRRPENLEHHTLYNLRARAANNANLLAPPNGGHRSRF